MATIPAADLLYKLSDTDNCIINLDLKSVIGFTESDFRKPTLDKSIFLVSFGGGKRILGLGNTIRCSADRNWQ